MTDNELIVLRVILHDGPIEYGDLLRHRALIGPYPVPGIDPAPGDKRRALETAIDTALEFLAYMDFVEGSPDGWFITDARGRAQGPSRHGGVMSERDCLTRAREPR